jgi:hypothetical protein
MQKSSDGGIKMKERTYVDDVDRSVYDIKDKENDAYRIKSGLDASIVEKERSRVDAEFPFAVTSNL